MTKIQETLYVVFRRLILVFRVRNDEKKVHEFRGFVVKL